MRALRACLVTLTLMLGLSALGCGQSAVLTREDGAEWDGHLVLGESMTFGAEVEDKGGGTYELTPSNRVTIDDATIISIGEGPYGFTVTALARGETTLHVFAPGVDKPSDAKIVVE